MTESQRKPVPRDDGGELDTALAFLGFQRDSLLKKLTGLDDSSLRRELVPTGTNLLGLVQHMALGERFWLGHHVAGTEPEPADEDWTMQVPPGRASADVVSDYRAAIADSNAIIRAIGDPNSPVAVPVEGKRLSLRWVLAHLTIETARHAGHADIIRELIDGSTGR